MIKNLIVGNNCKVDPFAVDVNGDGSITAKDSLTLKMKIVEG